MSELLIQVVDDQDHLTGAATYEEVWEKGLNHRIVRVMVEDPNGRILLQKRRQDRDLYPGRWDNSAAGHVDEGDDYESAAKRELSEEIGINGVKLQEIGYYRTKGQFEWRQLNRFSKVYQVVVPANTEFKIQPDEVASVKWFTKDEISQMIKRNPNEFSDGLIEVFERFY